MKMKKILGIIAAGVMIMAMGITTMAADSPVSSGVVQGVTNAYDQNGSAVEVVVQPLTEEGQKAAAMIMDPAGLQSVMKDAYVEGMVVMDVQEAVVIGDKDLVVWPVTLTFSIPGVIPTTRIEVLHYKNGWEVVPSTPGYDCVTATFNDLSPVAFVVDQSTLASASEPTVSGETENGNSVTSSKTSGATSPKTGESSAVMGLGLAALLAAGGAFGLSRKKRA